MNKLIRILTSFPLMIALEGCNDEDESDVVDEKNTNIESPIVGEENTGIKSLIEENLSLWNSSGIGNYLFTYYASLNDCPTADPFPPRVITVENSIVVSVYVPAFGTTIDVGNSPTINDIFTSMAESAESNPMVFSESPEDTSSMPKFDQQYGFPVAYFIDVSDSECDGTAYSVSDFQ